MNWARIIALTVFLPLISAGMQAFALDKSQLDAAVEQLTTNLRAEGYWVGEGKFRYFKREDCQQIVAVVGHCYGNNPASPYGLYMLPQAPGEYRDYDNYGFFAESLGTGDLWPNWRLQKNEAIIFIGLTPPEHAYYGFRSYLYTSQSPNFFVARNRPFDLILNQSEDAERRDIFASLGASLNNHNLKTATDSAFNSPTAVITTADTKTEQLMQQHLAAVFAAWNLDKHAINSDRIPARYVSLGYDKKDDDFMMLARTAYPSSEVEAAQYRQAPPVTVLRVVPEKEPHWLWRSRMPAEPLPQRTNGWGEEHLKYAMDALVDAVIKRYQTAHNQHDIFKGLKLPFLSGRWCIILNYGCLGDNPDATYTVSLRPQLLPDDPNEFVVAVGINHTKVSSADGSFVGKSIYSNLAVYDAEALMGITSARDEDFIGSTRQYWPHAQTDQVGMNPLEAAGDQLYALVIARNCNGFSHCLEVPSGENGLSLDTAMQLVTRAYVNPETQTGPAYSEILAPSYIRFSGR